MTTPTIITSSSRDNAYFKCISGVFDLIDNLAISNANSKALKQKVHVHNYVVPNVHVHVHVTLLTGSQ